PKFWSKEAEKKAKDGAMLANSLGAGIGAFFGVPTVITYLESASGIKAGGKTGTVAIVVGVLFMLSLFFFPLIKSIPIEAVASTMIIVGLLMISGIGKIKYSDETESIPALLTFGTIPFTYSIAYGVGIGAISYVFLKWVSGRRREIHPAMYVIALLSMLDFVGVF
ncbi:MAG: solute carrier family 23 protein, partial [Candidatus Micrarchaeia archaeon]